MTIVYAKWLQGWRFILLGHLAVLFNVYRMSGNVFIAGLISEGEQGLTIQDDQSPPSLAIVSVPEQAWMPTLVLAQQAAMQLTEKNIKVILSRYYYRLADADRNAQLTHWHDAKQGLNDFGWRL